MSKLQSPCDKRVKQLLQMYGFLCREQARFRSLDEMRATEQSSRQKADAATSIPFDYFSAENQELNPWLAKYIITFDKPMMTDGK
jgi:hypothetical protein